MVIASCSPKEHEETFKACLVEAGLNSYLLQIANIREQCVWVVKDKDAATETAKSLIKAAFKRVTHHQPIPSKEIDCQPHVLVVGAGVTGISAALEMAQKNRKVYLVEKSPAVGGKLTRYGEAFPKLECASCMLEPKIAAALHNDHIQVFTFSEVTELLGFYGNYIAKVNRKARYVDEDLCLGCEECEKVCPVTVKNEYNEGLNNRKAIFTPYRGALPAAFMIDKQNCLRFKGQECTACNDACPFQAIKYDDIDKTETVNIGAVLVATGFDVFDLTKAPQFGYGVIENVLNSLEAEYLLNTSGPTEGKILKRNGEPPKNVAIVHCVGSRSKKFNQYCSSVCCQNSLKLAHLIKKQLPDISVSEIYRDMCLPGKDAQAFFNKVKDSGEVNFLRVEDIDRISILKDNSDITLNYLSDEANKELGKFDMVILSMSMEGSKFAGDIARVFEISTEQGNYFVEEHGKLAPVSTTTEGIYIAGCAQGPHDVSTSVAQGQAAAGKMLSRLIPGQKLVTDPRVSEVDAALCSGCKSCISVCVYKAITFDDQKQQANINEVLCRGCGVCVASCPSSAIIGRHFTDEQLMEEMKALLQER